jgi:hypothetical protein
MKKMLFILLTLLLSGCATQTLYTVSSEEYAQQVKTLGVLPVLIDVDSIHYDSRDDLVALLERSSAEVQQVLVDKLRKQGRYFDVRQVSADPQTVRTRLLAGQVSVGEAAATRLQYRFNPQGSSKLSDEAVVDALLVVIVHGITRQEKRWSSYSLQMEYLWDDYNSLLYTAAIVDPTGRVLWQLDMPTGDVLLRLDYPDFTEAYWNKTESVRIKPISLSGLQQTLKEPEAGLLVDKNMPKTFGQMIAQILRGVQ